MSAETHTPADPTADTIVIPFPDRGVEQAPQVPAHEPTLGSIRLGQDAAPAALAKVPAAFRSPAWGRAWRPVKTAGIGAASVIRKVWEYEQAGSYAEMIRLTELQHAVATDPEEKKALLKEIEQLQVERGIVARSRHRSRATITGAGVAAGVVLAVAMLTAVVGLVAPVAAGAAGAGALYLAGCKEEQRRQTIRDHILSAQAPAVDLAPHPMPQEIAAPLDDPGQISDQRIVAALRDIKLLTDSQTIRPVGIPATDQYGNTTIEFALPANVICEQLQRKDKAFAGALGLSLDRIDIQQGEAEGDVRLWLAGRTPFTGPPPKSPLVDAERWSIWDGAPFGTTRKGERETIQLLWSSMLFGGAQGFGKTTAMRLPAAAGVLDPHCRILLADFKGGADWEELEQVADEAIIGADPDSVDRFVALVDRLIEEMDRRFSAIRAMPKARRPDMRLTPQIAAEDDMPVLLFLIDEIQEAFGALIARSADRELGIPSGRQQFAQLVEKLARLIRRGRACGLIVIAAGQRPDADSVPTAFRDVILTRYSVHTVDDSSSDMILGDGAAKRGATARGLGRLDVGILVTPSKDEKIQRDHITPQEFEQICARGRRLRIEAGTLTGHAAGQQREVGGLVGQMLQVFAEAGNPEHLTTTELVAGLAGLDPDEWAEAAAGDPRQAGTRLGKAIAAELDGTGRSLVKVERAWGKGYFLADIRAAAGIAPK